MNPEITNDLASSVPGRHPILDFTLAHSASSDLHRASGRYIDKNLIASFQTNIGAPKGTIGSVPAFLGERIQAAVAGALCTLGFPRGTHCTAVSVQRCMCVSVWLFSYRLLCKELRRTSLYIH